MCGRYASGAKTKAIASAYDVDEVDDGATWSGSWSIAPTTLAPVVREEITDDGAVHRELDVARWGLRPAWLDEKRRGFHNARLETVASKPAFRSSVVRRRAVVPMSGYYEWVAAGGGKQPYYLHPRDEDVLLSAAGLYEFSKDTVGEWAMTFTVLTRTGVDAAGEVHDRMPVFLDEQAWRAWIAPGELGQHERDDLLQALDDTSQRVAAGLLVRPVAKTINNVRTADPRDSGLIAPIDL